MILLLTLLSFLFAIGFWLDRYELLYSDSGVVFGAGYTDIHARIFASTALTIVTIISSLLIILSTFLKKGFYLLPASFAIFAIAFISFRTIYPSFQQKFIVEPNELEKEKPYIENNIKYTRLAYGLDKVNRHSYSLPENNTISDKFLQNKSFTDNIRL